MRRKRAMANIGPKRTRCRSLELLSPEMRQFAKDVEDAAQRWGITTREGLCLHPETGLISDAMTWEIKNED